MNDYLDQVAAAEKRVRAMDVREGRKDRNLRTILLALEAGLKQPEIKTQFDAFVLLREVVEDMGIL